MSETIIKVQNLGKCYVLGHQSDGGGLRHAIEGALRNPWGWMKKRASQKEAFWALNDVSFEVNQGDVVGIIGRNGAGKSTLLKILSRITEPTRGRIEINGRVASLLEVGTGFHQELTGRENIFLNGAILGMSRMEIKRKFDEIVAFSEVEKFLDTPVKRYSSGMYVRLAFAVAAHLEPEILVVDEVLAVGDAAFQKKCLGKMRDVSTGGRTVLFVSHNMVAVSQLCTRGIVIESGKSIFNGQISDAIRCYATSLETNQEAVHSIQRRPGSGELRFNRVETEQKQYLPDEPKSFRFQIAKSKDSPERYFVSGLIKLDGEIILQFDSRLVDAWYEAAGETSGVVRINHPWLKPGHYKVDLFICTASKIVDQFDDALAFQVIPQFPYPGGCDDGSVRYGSVLCNFSVKFNES